MVRNKELRQLALACAVIAALSAVGGFALHPAAGFLSLVSSAALGGVFLGLPGPATAGLPSWRRR